LLRRTLPRVASLHSFFCHKVQQVCNPTATSKLQSTRSFPAIKTPRLSRKRACRTRPAPAATATMVFYLIGLGMGDEKDITVRIPP
jgi:hypothetical protein